MFFLEYLKMIQKKYKISNTELINECANDGIKISKGNLTHKMKGERTISEKEFESFIDAISPSIAEEENLRKLYKIYLFGEREYEEVRLIKEYIEGFGDGTTILPTYQNVDLSHISNIEQEENLKNILFTLFSNSWGQNTIKVFCQPEHQVLIDIIMCLSNQTNSTIEHIVCLNNDYKTDNNIYNIRCLTKLDKIKIKNNNYQVRYFYDKVNAKVNSFSIFPFFIIIDEYVLHISHDFKSGYLSKETEFVDVYKREFDRMYSESQDLFELVATDMDYLQLCARLEKQTQKLFYTLQYHPCIVFNKNETITYNCIKDDFAYKKDLLDLIKTRWEEISPIKGYHFHHPLGTKEFLETGKTLDMSEKIFNPIPQYERNVLMSILSTNIDQKCIQLNEEFINIPKGLSVVCYDNGVILISYKRNSVDGLRWILKEKSIYKSFANFFRYISRFEI